MNDSTTPSKHPAPITRKATRQVTRAAARSRQSAQAAGCARVLSRCNATLSDEARSFYAAAITDTAAAGTGQRLNARKLVDEWITLADTLLPAVIDGRVGGYGPVRLRYAAEIASSLADSADTPREVPGASQAPAEQVADGAALLRDMTQKLHPLGVSVSISLAATAAGNRVAHAIEAVVEAARAAQKTVPRDVLEDAGVTDEAIEALASAAHAAMLGHTSAASAKAVAHAAAWSEDVRVGRLARETRLLVAAACSARKKDGEIPLVRSKVLAKLSGRAKAKAPAPPTPPAP